MSTSEETITDIRTLTRGDHIAVDRKIPVEYQHHGIYLGHYKVADFGDTHYDKQNARPRKVTLSQFTDNGMGIRGRLVRKNYRRDECLPPEEAAQNAEKLIENPDQWGKYDLVKNNCEHFATRCKTGFPVSWQVIRPVIVGLGVVAAFVYQRISRLIW